MSIVPPPETTIRNAYRTYKAATADVVNALGGAGQSCKELWDCAQATPVEDVSEQTRNKLSVAIGHREYVAGWFQRTFLPNDRGSINASHWQFLFLLKDIGRLWRRATTTAPQQKPVSQAITDTLSNTNRFEPLQVSGGAQDADDTDTLLSTVSPTIHSPEITAISSRLESVDSTFSTERAMTSEQKCDMVVDLLETCDTLLEFVKKTCQEFVNGEVDYITVAMVANVAYEQLMAEISTVSLFASRELDNLDKPMLAGYGLTAPWNLIKNLRKDFTAASSERAIRMAANREAKARREAQAPTDRKSSASAVDAEDHTQPPKINSLRTEISYMMASHASLERVSAEVYLCPAVCDLLEAVKGKGSLKKLQYIVTVQLLFYVHLWHTDIGMPAHIRIHFGRCMDRIYRNLTMNVARNSDMLEHSGLSFGTETYDLGIWSMAHHIARLETAKTEVFASVFLDPSVSDRAHRMFFCGELLRLASRGIPRPRNPIFDEIYPHLRHFFFRSIDVTDDESLQRAWKVTMSPGTNPRANTAKRCRNYVEDQKKFAVYQLFKNSFRPQFLWDSKPSGSQERRRNGIEHSLQTIRDMVAEQLPHAFQGVEVVNAMDHIRRLFLEDMPEIAEVVARVDGSSKTQLDTRMTVDPVLAYRASIIFERGIEFWMTNLLNPTWSPVIKVLVVDNLSLQTHRATQTGTINLPEAPVQALICDGHGLMGTTNYPLSADPRYQLAQFAAINAIERFVDLDWKGGRSRYAVSYSWVPSKDEMVIVAF